MRAQLNLPPIEQTLGGADTAAQIQQNYVSPPPGTVSSHDAAAPTPSTSSVSPPPSPVIATSTQTSVADTATSAVSAAANSSSEPAVPYLSYLQNTATNASNILSRSQLKALGLGVGGALAAYGVYKGVRSLTRKKHSPHTRHSRRRRYTARRSALKHRSVRRSRAHLVKGSRAAKMHMARLRKMRKR